MSSQLEQLKKYTTVVADTGDFKQIRAFNPSEATTNPSLILQAASKPEYADLISAAVQRGKAACAANANSCEVLAKVMDEVLVGFGCEILSIVPGRVSTEVDARLSFDKQATIDKARQLIALYEQNGIDRKRVLIKIASTWEGIQAAAELEQEGIHCNLTLLFSMAQAVACAEAKVFLISPFVGRILDWYKAKFPQNDYSGKADPGVVSVQNIFNYYKKFGYKTQVMGASFRNVQEIINLAGCDLLTISPGLLAELAESSDELQPALDSSKAAGLELEKISYNEAAFRFAFNQDAMATEKTAEGIRNFTADTLKLEALLLQQLS